jgi:hypothetical protein
MGRIQTISERCCCAWTAGIESGRRCGSTQMICPMHGLWPPRRALQTGSSLHSRTAVGQESSVPAGSAHCAISAHVGSMDYSNHKLGDGEGAGGGGTRRIPATPAPEHYGAPLPTTSPAQSTSSAPHHVASPVHQLRSPPRRQPSPPAPLPTTSAAQSTRPDRHRRLLSRCHETIEHVLGEAGSSWICSGCMKRSCFCIGVKFR